MDIKVREEVNHSEPAWPVGTDRRSGLCHLTATNVQPLWTQGAHRHSPGWGWLSRRVTHHLPTCHSTSQGRLQAMLSREALWLPHCRTHHDSKRSARRDMFRKARLGHQPPSVRDSTIPAAMGYHLLLEVSDKINGLPLTVGKFSPEYCLEWLRDGVEMLERYQNFRLEKNIPEICCTRWWKTVTNTYRRAKYLYHKMTSTRCDVLISLTVVFYSGAYYILRGLLFVKKKKKKEDDSEHYFRYPGLFSRC